MIVTAAMAKERDRDNFPMTVVRTPWSGRVQSQPSSMTSSGPRGPDYMTTKDSGGYCVPVPKTVDYATLFRNDTRPVATHSTT